MCKLLASQTTNMYVHIMIQENIDETKRVFSAAIQMVAGMFVKFWSEVEKEWPSSNKIDHVLIKYNTI